MFLHSAGHWEILVYLINNVSWIQAIFSRNIYEQVQQLLVPVMKPLIKKYTHVAVSIK